jgi:hypothetical protein
MRRDSAIRKSEFRRKKAGESRPFVFRSAVLCQQENCQAKAHANRVNFLRRRALRF